MPVYRFAVDGEGGFVYARTEDAAADEIYDLYGDYPDWIKEADL